MKPIQFLLAIDQVFNTLLGGWADEAISARAYRCSYKRKWAITRKIIDGIFFWQEEHCRKAYFSETNRQQLPPEYRGDPP